MIADCEELRLVGPVLKSITRMFSLILSTIDEVDDNVDILTSS
jgi:hypothetical protein